MANWYGHARTNYFRVKDIAAFREALSVVDLTIYEGTAVAEGMVTVLSEDEYGGWPGWIFSEEGDGEDIEFDLAAVIAEHLEEGQVAVLIEVGAEKLRYLTGRAIAVNSQGEKEIIDLEEIYDRAGRLGENVTVASY